MNVLNRFKKIKFQLFLLYVEIFAGVLSACLISTLYMFDNVVVQILILISFGILVPLFILIHLLKVYTENQRDFKNRKRVVSYIQWEKDNGSGFLPIIDPLMGACVEEICKDLNIDFTVLNTSNLVIQEIPYNIVVIVPSQSRLFEIGLKIESYRKADHDPGLVGKWINLFKSK